jgi:hypothetical protein
MSAATILTDLTAWGVRIWTEADRIKLDAPNGVLTDGIKAQLAAHKAELLAILGSQSAAAEENVEMHDSALFNLVIMFHGFADGPVPLRIPQESTPEGWTAPF